MAFTSTLVTKTCHQGPGFLEEKATLHPVFALQQLEKCFSPYFSVASEDGWLEICGHGRTALVALAEHLEEKLGAGLR